VQSPTCSTTWRQATPAWSTQGFSFEGEY